MGVSLSWAVVTLEYELEKEVGKCVVESSSCWEGGLLVDKVSTERGIEIEVQY